MSNDLGFVRRQLRAQPNHLIDGPLPVHGRLSLGDDDAEIVTLDAGLKDERPSFTVGQRWPLSALTSATHRRCCPWIIGTKLAGEVLVQDGRFIHHQWSTAPDHLIDRPPPTRCRLSLCDDVF